MRTVGMKFIPKTLCVNQVNTLIKNVNKRFFVNYVPDKKKLNVEGM